MNPGRSRSVPPAPDWLRDVPLAHRGLHGPDVPGNSLAAMEAAREAAVGIELDVRLAGDGVPVVVHDPTVRVGDEWVRVSDLDSEQLADVAGEPDHPAGDDHGIPTLARALEVADDVPVMVEVKNEGTRIGRLEAAVATVLARHHESAGVGATCVASFNPLSLRWLRRRRPAVHRVLTYSPGDEDMPTGLRWTLRSLRVLSRVEPIALSCHIDGITDGDTQAWREAGGSVVAWTVTNSQQLARGRQWADNVIFENIPVDTLQ